MRHLRQNQYTNQWSYKDKIFSTVMATVLVTGFSLLACGQMFAPCSTGYPYGLIIAVYPFIALLGSLNIVAPGAAILLILAQYPVYGFFFGRAWVTRKPLAAIIVLAVHILAAVVAAVRLRDNL
jgi:hypothetical protein